MTSKERKNYQSFSNSWLSAVKFVEKRQILLLAPTNPDLWELHGAKISLYTAGRKGLYK